MYQVSGITRQSFRFRYVLVFILSGLILNAKYLVPAYASTPALTVSPAIIQLDLSQDKPQTQISYTNHLGYPVKINFSSSDFSSLDNGWQVKFLDSQDAKNYHYALSSWISFNQNELLLKPNDTGSVEVNVESDELPPGSHYSSIIAQAQPVTPQGQVKFQVDLSTLLFVRNASGKEVEKALIESFDPALSLWNFPDRFVLRFNDTGNVDLTPYGEVKVFDPLNTEIAHGIVNQGSLITLPESIRRYDLPIKALSQVLLPGIYTAKLTLHFGKTNQYIYAQSKFFSLGSFGVLGTLTTLVTLIALTALLWRKLKAS